MKRRFLALFIIVSTMLSLLCSCGTNHPQYVYKVYSYDYAEEFTEVYEAEGKEPSKKQLEYVTNIFSVLCDYYNVNKDLPTIKVLTKEQAKSLWGTTEDGGCLALYDHGVLYLTEDSGEGVIAHELCHYLSDNSTYGGTFYAIDNIVVGRYLNEGITNYFSTQKFQHVEDYTVYEYETHIAKVLSIIFGEENLKSVFFNGDVSPLREDFNNSLKKYYGTSLVDDTDIKFEPFDVMASCLDTYTYAYMEAITGAMYGNVKKELVALSLAEAQCVEEMLVFYAKEKGMEKEVKEEISSFLEDTIIPFNFKELF